MALSSYFYLLAVRERRSLSATTPSLPFEDEWDEEEYDDEQDHRALNPKKKKVKTLNERFIVVTEKSKFFPPPGEPKQAGVFYYDEFTLSETMLNSRDVYRWTLEKEKDAKLSLWNLGDPIPRSFYTQLCTVTKGEADFTGWPATFNIQESICDITFCFKNKKNNNGCIFLRSGQLFDFDSKSANAWDIPEIDAAIIGGTGSFANHYGNAKIKTLLRSDETTSESLALKIEIYYKEIKKFPVYKPTAGL